MRRSITIATLLWLCAGALAPYANAKSDDELFAEFRKDSFPAMDTILGMTDARRDKFLTRCLEEGHPRDLQNQCLQIIEYKKLNALLPLLEKIHRNRLGGGVRVLSSIRELDKDGPTITRIILDDIKGDDPGKKLEAASMYFQVFPASATADFVPVLDTSIKSADDEHLVAISLLWIIEKGHDQYCTRLDKFKNSTDKKIKKTLIRALGYCGNSKDIPSLQKIYDEGKSGAGDALIASKRIILRSKKTKEERFAFLSELMREGGGEYTRQAGFAMRTLKEDILRGDQAALALLRTIAGEKNGVGQVANKELRFLEKERGIK